MAMADHTNEPIIPVSDEDFLYYHHDDHLGSSHVLTEGKDKGYHSGVTYNKGDLLQRFEYEPFGREKYVLNPNLNIDPSYTGQTYDVESGLYYYHARYYDPTLARFIQPDTIVPDAKNLQEFNRYGYVTNNPLKYTDPTGHFRIGGESFSGGPLGGFGEGFTGGFAGGGTGILQAFGSGLSLIFDMFKQNSWNEEVVADGSGDSQYYYEYEGSNHPGGILGGVVATPLHFEYGDDKSWFSLDTAPTEIELTLVLGIWGYVFAPQLQEMLDSKLWGYAHLAGMFVGGGTKVAASWGLKAAGRVFWSGNGNPAIMKIAMNFAKNNNMTTLEMTLSGQAMNALDRVLPNSISRSLWEKVSANFARGTKGSAHVFHNATNGIGIESIWRLEYKILRQNNVDLIYHNIF